MDASKEIHSLTEFEHNSSALIKQLQETGHPLILTVDGTAQAVVLNAKAYQQLVELAERARSLTSIQKSIEDIEQGKIQPIEQALEALGKKYEV